MARPEEFLAWAVETFGDVARDPDERRARFIEEAIELAHACGMPQIQLLNIVDRVYSRPRGSTRKEVGQAVVTLEMLAETLCICAEDEAASEFARVQRISKDEWTARHQAKVDLGIALPTSPLAHDKRASEQGGAPG